jgi:hypothetical protein
VRQALAEEELVKRFNLKKEVYTVKVVALTQQGWTVTCVNEHDAEQSFVFRTDTKAPFLPGDKVEVFIKRVPQSQDMTQI